VSSHDIRVYSRNLTLSLGFIQLVEKDKRENLNDQINIKGFIHTSLKGQAFMLSINQDPSFDYEINKCRCTIL